MTVSMRELLVLIRRVLFTRRWPTHATFAASRLIAALEMRDGRGLEALAALPACQADTKMRAKPMVDADGLVRIDAGGQSALLLGPSAMDAACAQARRRGYGLVLCESVSGLPFATVLDALATRRGIASLVAIAQPGMLGPVVEAGVDAHDWPPIDRLGDATHAVVYTRLADEAGSSLALADTRRVSGWPAVGETGPAVDETGDVLIACRASPNPGPPPDESRWVPQRGYDWIEMDGVGARAPTPRERSAIEQGIEVCAAQWSQLEAQVIAGLAPVSARSRMDAG